MALSASDVMDKAGFTPRLAGIHGPVRHQHVFIPFDPVSVVYHPFFGSLCALHPPMIWAVIGAFMYTSEKMLTGMPSTRRASRRTKSWAMGM